MIQNHLISGVRPARINSGGNHVPEMSSWCCSISFPWSCTWCSNGNMCSDGTGLVSFKSKWLIVHFPQIPFYRFQNQLGFFKGSLTFSLVQHGICEIQAVEAFAILCYFVQQRIRLSTNLLELMLPSSMLRNGPCTTFFSIISLGNSFPVSRKSSHK